MDTSPGIRTREIFARAVEQTDEARARYLDEACGGDAELRASVESLLAAHQRAAGFLSDPEITVDQYLTPDNMAVGNVAVGNVVGPYTLVKRLGEGGYGSVFLAAQDAPVRRQVALKVIKPGMDSSLVIARFEAERQALALMEHPNIARVLDAGTTSTGRPYFVMEYVEGVPITTYCAGIEVTERLALFVRVCMAVQHAHQKGIIHRDLKPANILVTVPDDGVAVPKVIDFGIAKAVETSIGERALLTTHGQFLGTPQYMSPEQAGSASDVDTRTDIYGLGAILYELLTGLPAFDLSRLRSAAGDEMQRVIREVDPPLPSARMQTRIRESSGTTSGGDARAARQTAHRLRGELDWIVMRCLEKDRARRYQTPGSLAKDISRFLAHEPVDAGPPGTFYRFSKFARRHRAALIAAALVAVSLVGGLAVATAAWVRARHDRDVAVAARMAEVTARQQAETSRSAAQANEVKAKAEAQRLMAVQTFLYRLLSPPRRGGEAPPVAFLDFASKKIDEDSTAEQTEIQGPVHAALGNAYYRRGLVGDAEREYRKAMEALRRANTGDDPQLASAINNTGTSLIKLDRFDEAETLLIESLAMYRRLNHGRDNIANAPVLLNLAKLLARKRQYAEATAMAETALVHFRKYYGDHDVVVAGILEEVAGLLEDGGQTDLAVRRRAEATEIRATARSH